MKYSVGSRKSKLALIQTHEVISQLKKLNPNDHYEIKTILTKGDVIHKPIFMMNRKGIFEKEIDLAVLHGEIDFAVHSLKDIPTTLNSDLTICCIPKRSRINDIFISINHMPLNKIKTNSIVGTSSIRRAIQITRIRPDVIIKPLRGNIESRINILSHKHLDGVILAKAGIMRIGYDGYFSNLSLHTFPPSPGQGALGIVCKKDNTRMIEMLKNIEDKHSRLEADAERSLSFFVESGCKFPIGAYAKIHGNSLLLSATAYSIDGKKSINTIKKTNKNNTKKIGEDVYNDLHVQGIDKMAKGWKTNFNMWCDV